MMTFKQKLIAMATILFLNVVVVLFMGPFVILSLLASIPLAIQILRR